MKATSFLALCGFGALLIASSALQAADLPTVGAKAPDFTLQSQEGKTVNLHDFKGQWVVLYFYPRDMTAGCTIEAHNFERDLAMYDAKKAAILGVSVDSVDSHQEFCTKESLTFKLLADTKKEVTAKYGSLSDYKGTAIVAQHPDWLPMAARNTFLIDPQGVIRKVYTSVNPNPHSKEVLEALTDLQKNSSN